MATLKDIAADLGISITTVSVVLNGKADERGIALETREKIVETAKRLGFRHNAYARALRSGRSNLIAIVGANFELPIPVMTLRHSAQAFQESGYNVVFYDAAYQSESSGFLMTDLQSRRVDAVFLICDPRILGGLMDRILEMQIPIVTHEQWGLPGVDVVTVDREVGSYEAVRHLIEIGHRRICLPVPPTTRSTTLIARLRGYLRAHEEAGVAVDQTLLMEAGEAYPVYRRGYDFLPQVIENPAKPSALFCINDQFAIGAMRALYERGLRVPDDLALVGFDGTIEGEYAIVPLTTVIQPIYEVTQAAASLLLDRLQNPQREHEPQQITVPSRLLVRDSSGAHGRPA